MIEELSEREKLIYLAGYIDSDGSIGIGQQPSAGRKAYRLNLDISSTNGDIIKWLTSNFNGRVGDGSNPLSTCKPLTQWRLHDRDAYKLIRDVRPYLLLKYEQSELAIGFYQDCIRRKQKGVLRPNWLISREEVYHTKMHELNGRGKNNCVLCEPRSKQEQETSKLSEREKLIYLTSLIDAEGSVSIYHASQPSKNYYAYLLMLTISNTDTRMIDWLTQNYGGWTQWKRYKNENWRDIERWTIGGNKTYRLLKQVRPFLIVKPKQADLAIEFYRKCITNTGKRLQWRKDKAYEYYMQMKALNKRGPIDGGGDEELMLTDSPQRNQLSLSSFD